MRHEDPIEYVPAVKSQSVVWKICRNLAVLWALGAGALTFASWERDALIATFAILSAPAVLIAAIGLAFRR